MVAQQWLNNRTIYLDFVACSLHSSNQPANCNNDQELPTPCLFKCGRNHNCQELSLSDSLGLFSTVRDLQDSGITIPSSVAVFQAHNNNLLAAAAVNFGDVDMP